MLTKALRGLKIIDESAGQVQAVFATYDVIDHDDDVTVKGAFDDGAPVRVSAYNHASWTGALPVGKGVIADSDDAAVADLQFFMNTTHGADTFETVKQMGDLQEWSYGFDIEQAEPGTKNGQRVQFLKKLTVHEVSPVLLGSGIQTRTLAAKGRKLATCDECGKSATPLFDGGGQLKALICRDCGHVARKQLDSDLEEELCDAGSERYGSAGSYVWLYDHDVDENYAVFSISPNDGGETRYARVNFTRNDDGTVTLEAGEQYVEPQTSFVPEKSKGEPDSKGDDTPDESAPDGQPDGTKTPAADSDGEPPKASQDESEQRLKLSEHVATVTSAVEELVTRLSAATKQRVEQDGHGLADATVERVEQLAASAERLREAVAIEPPDQAKADTPDGDSRLTLEDEMQLAELGARHGVSV